MSLDASVLLQLAIGTVIAGFGYLLKRSIEQSEEKLVAVATDVKALMSLVGDQRGDIRLANQRIATLEGSLQRVTERVDSLDRRQGEA